MAIIGKIREKSWLMLVIIGGALMAFIFTDYNKMTGNVESIYGYGTIHGEKVSIDDFNKDVILAQANADRNAQQQQPQQPATPVDKDQVWNSYTERLLLTAEYNALGIDVSENELEAYLYGKEGFSVLPSFATQFTDPKTGLFDENLLRTRIEEMDNSDEILESYKEIRKQEKYFAILDQGLYVTNLEGKNEYTSQKEIKTVSYVLQRYKSIADDEIPVSDEALKAFYEEHKNEAKYANKTASRDIRFFDVTVSPSSKDSTRFNSLIDSLKIAFKAAENDSLFVINKKNSDFNFFASGHQFTFRPDSDEKAKQRGLTYPASMDTLFTNASIGDVIGPYNDNGTTRLAKIIDFNTNLLSVRHILISAQRQDTLAVELAQVKVDSLLPLINKENFDEMAELHSQDRQPGGPLNNGGKYEDFMDYEMVPEFSAFATEKSIGTIDYVQTDYGFHIMEVLGRKEIKAPIMAIAQKTLTSSLDTRDDIDSEVDNMIYSLDEKISPIESGAERVAMFDTMAIANDYLVRPINIQENGPRILGFQTSFAEDKLLQLAFSEGAQVGDLVDSPIKEKNRYIIAILASIKDAGTPSFEDVKPMLERELIKAEKVKRLKKQMVGVKTLEALTDKLAGTTILKAEITFLNPQITGAGYEPDVVGSLFSGLKDGETTVPIEGSAGVYVVKIEKTTKAPTAANYDVEKGQLLSSLRSGMQGNAKKALAKLGDVVDNRRFFDANIRK